MANTIPHQEEIIRAILRLEPTLKRIFLFGSRVRRGLKNANADIDLGIVAEKELGFLRLSRIEQALDEIDTLYSIDLVDFTRREDSFTKEALKNMESLYESA